MRRLLRDNGLSIAMFGLFFVFVSAECHGLVGLQQHPRSMGSLRSATFST